MNRISYSQFTQYINCNKQYELSYIRRLSLRTPSLYTVMGTSVHETIQQYYDKNCPNVYDYENILFKYIKNNIKLAKKQYQESFVTAKNITEYYSIGIELLNQFINNRTKYIPNDLIYVNSEYELFSSLSFIENKEPFKNVNIIGFIDMLFKDINSNYIIYDIKTSNKKWTNKEKKDKYKLFQLILYKKLLSILKNIPEEKIIIKYLILSFNQKKIEIFNPDLTLIDELKLFDELKEFIQSVFNLDGSYNKDKEFNMIDNKENCKWCEYKGTPYCTRFKLEL